MRRIMTGVMLAALLCPSFVWAGSWSQETIAQMPTRIYTPTTSPALNGKRALMISMGGCGQQDANNTEFKDQSNWPPTADEYGMVVAIPNAPGGGVLWAGCWDYYDENHTRGNRHNDNLLALVAELKSRSSLNIDPNQVYVSGLSSGGGMVNVMTCIAPDVFAGGGNSAGPALGTASGETTMVATDPQTVRNLCRQLAGSNVDDLDTQVMSVVWGTSDYLAAPGYRYTNAEAYALIYGASKDSGTETIPGNSLDGVEETWSDSQGERVSLVTIEGLSHAWPAGGGPGTSQYMDNTSINYPAHLTAFLFANNRRVGSQPPPPPPGNSLTLNPPLQMTLDECEAYQEPGYSANDEQLGDVTDDVNVSGDGFDTCTPGDYTISYSVTFSDGTSSTKTRDVTVEEAPTYSCTEYTSSNWSHYQAGRAEYCPNGYQVCAKGSGDLLGYNVSYPSNVVLAETAPDYFIKGNCP